MPQTIQNPISQASASLEFEGHDYYFTEFSGIEIEFATTDYAIGLAGGDRLEIVTGGKKRAPFTLKKPMQAVDESFIAWCEDPCSEPRTLDVTLYEICPDKPLYTLRISGCKCKKITHHNIDLNGDDMIDLEAEFVWQAYERV